MPHEEAKEMTPLQLYKAGLSEVWRVFIKNEPHLETKASEGRFRLIFSSPIVTQISQRVLFSEQNNLEIDRWHSIPSKPGIGFDESSVEQLVKGLPFQEFYSTDISGWDWSVKEWELMAEAEMRIRLITDCTPAIANAVRNSFLALSRSLFQLSDGRVFQQNLYGIMKSGAYVTSSSNSRIRVLVAYLSGSLTCVAMGDDALESGCNRELYETLGHTVKDVQRMEITEFDFCSHRIKEGKSWLLAWPKSLYRFLTNSFVNQDVYSFAWSQVISEVENNPDIFSRLSAINLWPDHDWPKDAERERQRAQAQA